MNQFDPGNDRWKLGFKEAVLASFPHSFVPAVFKAVTEDVTLVRYESESAFVNVYHGRGSFEVGVEIGLLDRPEKYSLDYIVSAAGSGIWAAEGFGRWYVMFQVSTKEGVQNVLPRVAQTCTEVRPVIFDWRSRVLSRTTKSQRTFFHGI